MQAVHFCFTLGGMLSPLVAQPFLAADNCLAEEGNNGSLMPRNISESLKNFSAFEKYFVEISEVGHMRSELFRNISSNHHGVNYSFIRDLTSCANEKTSSLRIFDIWNNDSYYRLTVFRLYVFAQNN